MKEKDFKKGFDLDDIDMKWEDEVFPEDKLLGALINSNEKKKIQK